MAAGGIPNLVAVHILVVHCSSLVEVTADNLTEASAASGLRHCNLTTAMSNNQMNMGVIAALIPHSTLVVGQIPLAEEIHYCLGPFAINN